MRSIYLVAISLFVSLASKAQAYPIYLQSFTVDELVKVFAPEMNDQIEKCFNVYKRRHNPSAVMLSQEVANKFHPVFDSEKSKFDSDGDGEVDASYDCKDAYTAGQVVKGVLEASSRKQARLEEVQERTVDWASEQLKPHADKDGQFNSSRQVPLLFYDAAEEVERENALKRVKNPKDMNYRELFDAWDEMTKSSTLDSRKILPLILDPERVSSSFLFDDLRHFVLDSRMDYVSSGTKALTDFWYASEGPDGDRDFAPIVEALKSPSIKKRFYFNGAANGWSSNVLIVMDEYGQWFGFQMGYSE